MDAVRQSITSHGPLLMKIIESNTEYFHSILKKHRLTAIDPDKVTPSAIIQEISNLFKISKAEHMEDQCRKLISSLRTLGTLEAIDLSSQLRTEWKLKIPSLAHETCKYHNLKCQKRVLTCRYRTDSMNLIDLVGSISSSAVQWADCLHACEYLMLHGFRLTMPGIRRGSVLAVAAYR